MRDGGGRRRVSADRETAGDRRKKRLWKEKGKMKTVT